MIPGRLGLVRASALYVAAVLGTGILVLPSLAAKAAGPASILSVLAVLILSIPLAGTFAALASRNTLARWYYDYIERQQKAPPANLRPIESIGIDELSLKKSTGSSWP